MLVLAVALVVALVIGGCFHGGEASLAELPQSSASLLVQAPPELLAKCQATADEVGYSVPGPTRVPDGLTATPAIGRCRLDIIGSGATHRRPAETPGGDGWSDRARRTINTSSSSPLHDPFETPPRSSMGRPGTRTLAFVLFIA